MTLLLALAPALLFGAGVYLLLQRDLLRDVAGMILASNAATLFVLATGLQRGRAPILPVPDGTTASDPLVQAMALTAIVISFGVSALLLSLVYAVWETHGTIDQGDLLAAQTRQEQALDREERPSA